MLDFTTATVVCCALVGGLFTGLWVYYDRRDHGLYERARRRKAFHCIRCDALYATTGTGDLSPCPKCGHENVRLRF
jgi:uncharacterized iron-regulated membrane protein